jgi:transposase
VVEVRPVRKRRWTGEEKLAIVREGLQPGAVPTEVMRRHGISSSLFYTWRRQALATTKAAPVFTPVRIADAAPPLASPPRPTSLIEIILSNGAVVRIDGAVDARTLGVVLKSVCG